MKKGLIKLPRNRVRRNYLGGAGIDALHGETVCVDNNMPEEWVGSMVEATNPGMEVIPHEGLIAIETENGKEFLRDIVDRERAYYLGESIHKDGSWQLSFLLKILDSAMRLHVQAHPSTKFANEVRESLTESWNVTLSWVQGMGSIPISGWASSMHPPKRNGSTLLRSRIRKKWTDALRRSP